MADLPKMFASYNDLYNSIWNQPHLPPEVLALCAARLSQLHRCDIDIIPSRYDIAQDKRAGLANAANANCFSKGEKVCIEFTEVYAMDAQAITDAQADAVKMFFADSGLVLLIEALGILDGQIRLEMLFQANRDFMSGGQ